MMRFAAFLAAPRVQVWFNGALTVLWLIALIPTFLISTLRTSILYVALISVWALFATHLGAWIAALVNVKAERIDDRSAEHATLGHLEAMEARLMAELGVEDE
jgi:hypothetical protein